MWTVLTHVLLYVTVIVAIWICSVTVAWLINRKDLIRTYGVAPFTWRIYGYMYLYVPYLKKLQQERENK